MATTFSDHNTILSCLSNLCPLEPEDLLLQDLLQDKTDPQFICSACDECCKATSRCKECDEVLCDSCVEAHLRVPLSKDHCIVQMQDSQQSPPYNNASSIVSNGSPTNSVMNDVHCEIHITETVKLYCDSCCTSICGECTVREHRGHYFIYLQDAIEGARTTSVRLLSDAKMGAQSMKECIDLSQRMVESVNFKSHAIAINIRSTIRKIQTVLEERERHLLLKLEKIRIMKQKAIQQQVNGLKTILNYVSHTADILSDVIEVGSAMEVLQAKENTFFKLKKISNLRANMPPIDDIITFVPPDTSLLFALNNLGDITCTTYPQSTIGEGLLRNVPSRYPSLLFNKTEINSLCERSVPFLPSMENAITKRKMDISLSFHRMIAQNRAINSVSVVSRCFRNYIEAGRPQIIIGGEGEKEGQLCRPWGVCCDLEGNIIVADRSNNRIQIFKSDGSFLRTFGAHGSEPGYFDRPAGVATDPMGRIVVTDKDNHRIQVFTREGQFVFTFGEKGSKVGQFNYPWDIAVDANGRIVVSDTRNHRIQLFTADGTFLRKYGFETSINMVKHFDSPRGVCFSSKGCVIVTDFNNHRLVVVDPDFRNARFLGTEGSTQKRFLRPQGVVVDPDGNIIVADSRNNRIQIFEPNGSFISQFGTAGKEAGQMDRPSGICLTPEGKIVVVDFGNNRIQVF